MGKSKEAVASEMDADIAGAEIMAEVQEHIDNERAIVPLHDRFTILRRLTKPILSMAHLKELAVELITEPYEAHIALPTRKEGAGPTKVVDVVNLETGEEGMLILGSLISSAFQRAGSPLKGRFFALRSGTIREGKRYRDVDVVELRPAAQ